MPSPSISSYNPFDPIQDTERYYHRAGSIQCDRVTTHSIRYRILKGVRASPQLAGLKVTTHSIRYRILKALLCLLVVGQLASYNPFDPIQDTESWTDGARAGASASYNPFDPIQDTERVLAVNVG